MGGMRGRKLIRMLTWNQLLKHRSAQRTNGNKGESKLAMNFLTARRKTET